MGRGCRIESVQDPATVTTHPRNTVTFVYTENIAKSPVSDGVKGHMVPRRKTG